MGAVQFPAGSLGMARFYHALVPLVVLSAHGLQVEQVGDGSYSGILVDIYCVERRIALDGADMFVWPLCASVSPTRGSR